MNQKKKIDTTDNQHHHHSGSEGNGIIFSTLFPVSALSKKKKIDISTPNQKSNFSINFLSISRFSRSITMDQNGM